MGATPVGPGAHGDAGLQGTFGSIYGAFQAGRAAPDAGGGELYMKLAVKVVPGASRSGIAGWLGNALKVRVAAPPERGRANAAVEALVAGALGVPRSGVRVVTGGASPRKTLEIEGLCESEVHRRLSNGRAGGR